MASDLPQSQLLEALGACLNTEKLAALLHLVKTDGAALETILADASPRTAPVENYITDIEIRASIFRELQQIQHELYLTPLNPTALGIVMVAPLDRLQEWMRMTRTSFRSNDVCALRQSFAFLSIETLEAVKRYISMGGRPSTSSTPGVCFIAGTQDPEGAHIFPLSSSAESSLLYQVLAIFWGESKVKEYAAIFQDQGIIESPKNLLFLHHQYRYWWDRAKFAFKVIGRTDNEIHLQFHWLKAHQLKPAVQLHNNDFLTQANLDDNQKWGDDLGGFRKSGLPIRTGQVFVITFDDPNELPSSELLELQWIFLRIAAISGASGTTEDEYWDNDDDDSSQAYMLDEDTVAM